MEPTVDPLPQMELHCSPIHQKVMLDLDLCAQSLRGSTEILIEPHVADLRVIKLNCRQARITRLSFGSRAAGNMVYVDPYKQVSLPWLADVHQYHMLEDRIQDYIKIEPEAELTITLPRNFKITEGTTVTPLDSEIIVLDSPQAPRTVTEGSKFSPFTVYIEFVVNEIRDGLHFAGWNEADLQYPHAYTNKLSERSMCCLFPCFDRTDKCCTWEFAFRTSRTLGDAFNQKKSLENDTASVGKAPGTFQKTSNILELSEEDRALDLKVLCSGDITDEIADPVDGSKKTTSFLIDSNVSANQIGFAIGAFKTVNLTKFRDSNEDDRLGKNAIPIYGFCLPKRGPEVENICFPLAKAMDHIVQVYGAYPYSNFKVCFVDGMPTERIETATLSILSNRLLFPDDVIDSIYDTTRELIFGLAYQWVGINIVPKEATDLWAVIGIAYYMADSFLRKLSGNNEHRFAHCKAAEQLVNMDIGRPSLADSGRYLSIDESHRELINLKAPLVMFILDRRLTKISGSTGVARVIAKLLLNAKISSLADGALSTTEFFRTCERIGHTKLDVFCNQWVLGTGCPRFRVTQRFNKKRLVVEMQIMQSQSELSSEGDLQSKTFMREVKESMNEIWDTETQPVFTGPMTIRIHEADGTPYEHIVEIREAITRFEIPYNTKYKRLKRTRRNREKMTAGQAGDAGTDGTEESLLYCLGDVLQAPEEEADWKLSNWSKEDEEKMSSESYEWIRMDADFEWICKMSINMPGYMYVSQLQQDRDVNAQNDTILYLAAQKPLDLVSSILARTLADRRYFHGIRSAAAIALVNQAKDETGLIGLHHLIKAFQSLSNSQNGDAAGANDFTDRASYYVRCSIITAIGNVRNNASRSPLTARKFLYNLLRGNDNADNEYSDTQYLAIILRALAEAQSSAPIPESEDVSDMEQGDDWRFQRDCINEIERLRRVDEWIPSYHNILSSAALDCRGLLAKVGSAPREPADFLQYTQDGTYEDLRVAAFRNLMQLGFLRHSYILKWFLFVLGFDSSPYIRLSMLRLFGEWIGQVALGENDQGYLRSNDPPSAAAGLIIEQDSSNEARKADIERKQTITGAKAALQAILGADIHLKEGIWQAMESPLLTLQEVSGLLVICGLLYQPHTAMTVVLKYPRYYKAVNKGFFPAGNGFKKRHIISFVPSKPRTTKMPPRLQPRPLLKINQPAPLSNKAPAGKKIITLKMRRPDLQKVEKMVSSKTTMPTAATHDAMQHAMPKPESKPRLKLKLKLPGQSSI